MRVACLGVSVDATGPPQGAVFTRALPPRGGVPTLSASGGAQGPRGPLCHRAWCLLQAREACRAFCRWDWERLGLWDYKAPGEQAHCHNLPLHPSPLAIQGTKIFNWSSHLGRRFIPAPVSSATLPCGPSRLPPPYTEHKRTLKCSYEGTRDKTGVTH